MTTPRIEHIAENIKTAVSAITIANSFNQDLVGIRPKRRDFRDAAWGDGTVLISQREKVPSDEAVIGSATWWVQFALAAIVIDSDDAETSIDTRLNQVAADIEKKMMVDVTRGGYAIDTRLDGAGPFISDDGSISGVMVMVSVLYRTKIEDPYTGI